MNPRQKLSLYNTVLLAILLVCILVVVVSFGRAYKSLRPFNLTDDFQAVFLDNGQVYFGSVSKRGLDFVELTNIYYLQLRNPLQGQDKEEEEANASDLSLIKLGNELHGPRDKMIINKDHVLFIEDLKDDSKVVQAIRNHQKSK